MAVQRGRDLLIKMDMSGDGQFETVAGLRATRLSFNAETVDVTNLDSPGGWRELLAGAGVKAASLSGSGVFRDEATDERARAVFFTGEIPAFQVLIPDFGIVEGLFQITALEFAGSHNGEATYELSLASAGALSFMPITAGGPEPVDIPADAGHDDDDPPPIDDEVYGPGEGEDDLPPGYDDPPPDEGGDPPPSEGDDPPPEGA
jgi:TP901-1 family phage major tail protein